MSGVSVLAWVMACCAGLGTESPPVSLQRPYAVVADTVVQQTYNDPLADTTYNVEIAQVDITFPYRGYDGQPRVGHGRFYLPNVPGPPAEGLPLGVSIHYGVGPGAAAPFVHRGWAVLTPTQASADHGGNLVGDGLSHTLAMATLGRRLAWVDPARIAYFGGSAGGYQCLLASAMRFGAACAWADVPIVDLYYDVRYLMDNDRFNVGIENSDAWPVPVIHVVRAVGELTGKELGDDMDRWWEYSLAPLVPLIRQPMAITWCTADILVPVNQASEAFVRPAAKGAFPAGYAFDYDSLGNPRSGGRPFVGFLPADQTEVFVVPPPENAPRGGRIPPLKDTTAAGGSGPSPPAPLQRTPWSQTKRFSIILFDEGPPDPLCSHWKYTVRRANFPFFVHNFARGGLPADALTGDALRYLVARWKGQDAVTAPDGTRWLTRTDFEPFERWDVLGAVEVYLRSDSTAAARWSALYAALPAEDRVWDASATIAGKQVHARADAEPLAAIWYQQCGLARADGWGAKANQLRRRLEASFPQSAYTALAARGEE